MDDLDRELATWGAEWRSRQPPLMDAARVHPAGRTIRLRSPFRMLATASVVVIVVGAAVGLRLVQTRTGSASEDANTRIVKEGDAVTATGYMIEQLRSELTVCLPAASRLVGAPKCSTAAVPVRGLEAESIPGWRTTGGVSYAANVTVAGTWFGGVLQARTVRSVLVNEVPASPCQNAPGAGPPAVGEEQALLPVAQEAAANPTLYSGVWAGIDASGLQIPVVGVVGDLAKGESRIRDLYPYRICVTQVDFSQADLNTKVASIQAAHPDWVPAVDIQHDRVSVLAAVLDEETASALAPYQTYVYVTSLVRADP
jgi:hypothetical protein